MNMYVVYVLYKFCEGYASHEIGHTLELSHENAALKFLKKKNLDYLYDRSDQFDEQKVLGIKVSIAGNDSFKTVFEDSKGILELTGSFEALKACVGTIQDYLSLKGE